MENSSNLIERAFKELYPNKEFAYTGFFTYSGKFNGFNANIRLSPTKIDVRMSKDMESLAEEIQIGLIQTLLVKIFKKRYEKPQMTVNMDLYTKFLKNVHIALPKETESSFLLEKYTKINEQYFDGLLEQPSLKWGTFSRNKLGSYEYGSDTILLSKYLEHAPEEYLEYVLYHEMLHKKHKFTHTNGRSLHHSTAFKADEAKFPRAADLEKEIPRYIGRRRYTFRQKKEPQTIMQSIMRNFW
ncbi:MAG: SprT-like domain-containing protein [Nanoarchaeota archaeon]